MFSGIKGQKNKNWCERYKRDKLRCCAGKERFLCSLALLVAIARSIAVAGMAISIAWEQIIALYHWRQQREIFEMHHS
ncbi:hypothetical protein [Nostoc sp.]|uniref:hypothetical protein n=1 Tax=Nostoc sp. TaxID=1180 RepID=UPI002FF514F1